MNFDKVIVVEKLNEVFFKIHCSLEIGHGIKSYFECYAPGYRFHPKYKTGLWSGRISFFNMKDQTLPIGLYKEFQEFCATNGYEIKWAFDTDTIKNHIKKSEFDELFETLFPAGGKYEIRDYQRSAIEVALRKKRGVLQLPTGCHAKDTLVLMFNGQYKKVQDVVIGDVLMGDDGNPRNVLKLYNGVEPMYKITPIKSKKAFVVNQNHILHLFNTNDGSKKANSLVDISVKDYIGKSKTFKHCAKLFYNDTELDFGNVYDGKLSPYFVGVYLGDGSSHGCQVTTMDDVIVDAIQNEVDKFGYKITISIKDGGTNRAKGYNIIGGFERGKGMGKHIFLNSFAEMDLIFRNRKDRTKCGDRFIPDVLKYSSIEDRYELLAGLIDTDGNLSKGSAYDMCFKSKRLLDDTAFVAKSLGFFVTNSVRVINGVNYYRCYIQGDIWKIPVRIERKKAINYKKRKTFNVHGFSIESVGNGEFFGFQLDGNHLYMTDDGCVHHNSGKSLVAYSLIKFCKESTEGKILLIVPNVSLTEQMFGDMIDYGWYDALQHVSVVHGTSENIDFTKRIIISTWQSLQKKDPIFFERFQAVIVDECHSLNQKSNAIRTILKNCTNADYRFGLTGTVPKDKADQFNLFGYIGPVLHSQNSSELIDRGVLSKIEINAVLCRYSPEEIAKSKKMSYDTEMDCAITHPKRLLLIKKIVKKINKKENILILCDRIEHLKRMADSLKTLGDREIVMFHGSVPVKQREEIRAKIENSEGMVIVASYGTFSAGLNVKKLHHVMFASSTKSYTRTIQSIGRGLRLHESKEKMVLWDIVDDMRYKKRTGTIGENYLFEHFKERLKFYKESGFSYTTKKITLNILKEDSENENIRKIPE